MTVLQRPDEFRYDGIRDLQNLFFCETNERDSRVFEFALTNAISLRHFLVVMYSAIALDRDAQLVTIEV